MSSFDKNLLVRFPLESVKRWNSPQFDRHQTVSFFGGIGTIKSIQKQALGWAYHVEMSLGEEPDFGRIGAETTVVLEEHDLRSI